MKKFIFAGVALALTTLAVPAVSLAAQVDQSYRKDGGQAPFYGRSDGLYYGKTSKEPTLMKNGVPTDLYAIATYKETFGYGDGLGVSCSSVSDIPGDFGYTVANTDNTACDTTCGQSLCVIGLDSDGAADNAFFVACGGASADSCLCQKTGLDLYDANCGADWEAPAEGITLLETSAGTKLAHVALLEQLIGPDMDAEGLDIGADGIANDGVELFAGGMYGSSGRPLYPGVDPAFEFCVTVTITDDSDCPGGTCGTPTSVLTDDFWVGFRSVEPPEPAFNDYDTYFAIGMDNLTGDIHFESEDDGVGLDTDDVNLTAVTNGNAAVMCAKVDANGLASGCRGTDCLEDPDAFTFDSGEPVIPFVHALWGAGVEAATDPIHISSWEVKFTE